MSPLVLVTGSTDGIGRETALELARRGARVIVHGRSAERAGDAREAIAAAGPREVPEPLLGDFASLASVREMARSLEARGLAPDVIVNNAGIYAKERRTSAEGHELTFAVNHLAPFLLTHLVLAGPTSARLRRIVNVSSVAHTRGRIDLDALDGGPRFDAYAAYAASKLANVLMTVALARRLAPRAITVNALHPGVVSTKLLTEGFEMSGPDSLEKGAATSVKLALAPEVAETSGRYFSGGREQPSHRLTQDAEFVERFYARSLELTGAPAA